MLVLAEAFGSSNTSQIIDLNGNGANIFTPSYAIYETGALARVALFNFVTDASGGAAYTATINVTPSPAQVKVKYVVWSFFSSTSGYVLTRIRNVGILRRLVYLRGLRLLGLDKCVSFSFT